MIPVRSFLRYPQWLWAACLGLAGVLTLTTLAGRWSLLDSYSLDLNGAEENVVYGVIKALGPAPLYTDPEVVPFDVIQYSPAYYGAAVTVCQLLGVDGQDPSEVYRVVRSMGLALNLLYVLLAFGLARRLGADRPWAIVWAAVLLLFIPRQAFSRPDALHLVCFAAAMFAFLPALRLQPGSERTRRMDLAVVLAALDPFTKQSGILALLIIGAALLFTRQHQALLRAVLIAALVIGSGVLLLCLHYGADIVHANLVTGIRNGISATPETWLAYQLAEPSFPLVQLIGVVAGIIFLRRAEPLYRCLGIGLVLSLLFGHLTGLKHGSSTAYHMENMFLTVVVMALLPNERAGNARKVVEITLLGTALFCVRIMHLKWGVVVLLGNAGPDPHRAAYADAARMATEMQQDHELREGLVLLTAHDHLENFLVGRSVITQKDIVLLESSKAHFDFSGFPRAVANGDVRWVLSRAPVERLPMLGPPPRPLVPYAERHGYHIYLNPPAGAAAAADLR
ncbi:MAG TPA: hypothetical protein VGE21_16380 [Flavobacteriales bacterium]